MGRGPCAVGHCVLRPGRARPGAGRGMPVPAARPLRRRARRL